MSDKTAMDPPAWAVQEADKRAEFGKTTFYGYRSLAASLIAKYEPAPIDPLLEIARRICDWNNDYRRPGYLTGSRDCGPEMKWALDIVRQAYELGEKGHKP